MTMAYDFYWISGSPNAWRAMLALEYEGVHYVSHRLDPSKREYKTPEFLAINPRGQVPVLNADGAIITESLAIMAFLEHAYPTPALFGKTPAETGVIWQRIFEVVNYLRDPIETGIVRAISYGEAMKDPEGAKVAAGIATARLDWLEDILGRQPYLAGASVSAADIATMPIIEMLARFRAKPDAIALALGFDDLGRTHPSVAAWLKRLQAVRGYATAYPPHWRE
jgi:glutathione S-transferase